MKPILVAAAIAAMSSTAAAQAVNVTLSEWKVELSRDTVHAGPVTFRVRNAGTMTHGFYVTGPGVDKGSHDVPAGEQAQLTVTLKPGMYEVYCPMSDMTHKAAGMDKKIVVIAGAATAPAKQPDVR
jgi:uncharacterized cupredoxin-like copper-binding protein